MIRDWLHVFFLVIYILSLIGLPILITWLCKHIHAFKFIGTTITCFLTGMIVGNIIPSFNERTQLADSMNSILVPLGLVLMLFNTQLKRWIKLTGRVLLGYLYLIVGVTTMSVIVYFVFGTFHSNAYGCGMIAATYIGGTPNMAAVRAAFDIDYDVYNQYFLSDVVASSVYLLFIMLPAKFLIGKVLKKYEAPVDQSIPVEDINDYKDLNKPLWQVVKSILLGILVLGVSYTACLPFIFIYGKINLAWMILAFTLLAVVMSFIPAVRNNAWSFKTGDFLFNIFFMVMGTMTNFAALANLNLEILLMTSLVLFGGLTIQIILSFISKIDTDTTIITGAAGIMSPPFIPSIARAIKNPDLIAPGVIVGIIGLALGNIVGILIVQILMEYGK